MKYGKYLDHGAIITEMVMHLGTNGTEMLIILLSIVWTNERITHHLETISVNLIERKGKYPGRSK